MRHGAALGLELLSGLVYWKETGQAEMLADYQERFRHWLAGRDPARATAAALTISAPAD